MSNRYQDDGRNGQPPEGTAWGEAPDSVPDSKDIRRRFGIAPFEHDFDYPPYPNCLIHEGPDDDRGTDHVGGTNFLAVGEKGSGKSTLALYWATRLMEVNDEAVVWRGSTSRSEWLPLKPWTTLFIPANASVTATWQPRDIRKDTSDPAELSSVVREVIRYDDPRDINAQLEPGSFNVVYPDPSFSGCGEIMADSDRMAQPVEWTPKWAADEPGDATPLVHWWFAYALARLEYGPYDWTSLIFDECADLAPDSARAGRHETYEKIESLRRVMADSRKFYFSLFFLGHHEENLHAKVRRTVQWRVDMPDGTANPCQNNNDRAPVGFSGVPMYVDHLSRRPVGNALFWTETHYNKVQWSDMPDWPADRGRWLQLDLMRPSARARGDAPQPSGGEADD